MKMLLKGQPHSGKSTLVSKLIKKIQNKQGFLTEEILEGDKRVGFKMVSADGRETVLAHINIISPYQVSRYFVDVKALDSFLEPLFEFSSDQILYIDEIGQMELFSDKFKKLVDKYTLSDNQFIGTITTVYSDDFIKKLQTTEQLKLIEITPENREQILESLSDSLTNMSLN